MKRKKWNEMWEEIKQKPNSNYQSWKVLEMREEVWGKSYDRLEKWKWRGGWEKMEGIKRGAVPYVITSLFPTLAIMNLQTIAGFIYFHFHINMLKRWSSISRFRQKFPITFIIQQPTKTYKKVLAICEFFFLKHNEFGPFCPCFFF